MHDTRDEYVQIDGDLQLDLASGSDMNLEEEIPGSPETADLLVVDNFEPILNDHEQLGEAEPEQNCQCQAGYPCEWHMHEDDASDLSAIPFRISADHQEARTLSPEPSWPPDDLGAALPAVASGLEEDGVVPLGQARGYRFPFIGIIKTLFGESTLNPDFFEELAAASRRVDTPLDW